MKIIPEQQFLDAMDGLLRVFHSRADDCIRLTPSDFGRLLHIANRGRSPDGRGTTLKVVQAEVRSLPSAPIANRPAEVIIREDRDAWPH